jgi:hypothetical protein
VVFARRGLSVVETGSRGQQRIHPDEDALAIATTVGYTSSIVEHQRIAPGEGILGRVFATGRLHLGNAASERNGNRRLRYRSDSYLAVPLRAGGRCLGVV